MEDLDLDVWVYRLVGGEAGWSYKPLCRDDIDG